MLLISFGGISIKHKSLLLFLLTITLILTACANADNNENQNSPSNSTSEPENTQQENTPQDDDIDGTMWGERSEEHTSELQSRFDLVCRLLLEKKHKKLDH